MGNHKNNVHKRHRNEKDHPVLASSDTAEKKNTLQVNEEMGAEIAVNRPVVHHERREEVSVGGAERKEVETASSGLGWVSLVFAVASWFLWPVLLGATSAVLGYLAYRQGARGLGGWAMTIGLIALAFNLLIVPFYYAIT